VAMTRRALGVVVIVLAAIAAWSPANGAFAAQAARPGKQGKANQPPAATTPDGQQVSPAEVRRMFDSYALLQAQDALKISNEQFPKFLMEFKALQEMRRKTLQDRNRIVQELRRLSLEPTPNEAQLKDRMKELRDLEERGHNDVRKAYDNIDQVLDVKQQARFRVFEQQMEQRLLQLVARARQTNRAKQQQPKQ